MIGLARGHRSVCPTPGLSGLPTAASAGTAAYGEARSLGLAAIAAGGVVRPAYFRYYRGPVRVQDAPTSRAGGPSHSTPPRHHLSPSEHQDCAPGHAGRHRPGGAAWRRSGRLCPWPVPGAWLNDPYVGEPALGVLMLATVWRRPTRGPMGVARGAAQLGVLMVAVVAPGGWAGRHGSWPPCARPAWLAPVASTRALAAVILTTNDGTTIRGANCDHLRGGAPGLGASAFIDPDVADGGVARAPGARTGSSTPAPPSHPVVVLARLGRSRPVRPYQVRGQGRAPPPGVVGGHRVVLGAGPLGVARRRAVQRFVLWAPGWPPATAVVHGGPRPHPGPRGAGRPLAVVALVERRIGPLPARGRDRERAAVEPGARGDLDLGAHRDLAVAVTPRR